MRLFRHYRLEPYDGPATVFATDEYSDLYGGPSLGWDGVVRGEFKAVRAGGVHSDIWASPHLEKVGEHIRKIMAGQP